MELLDMTSFKQCIALLARALEMTISAVSYGAYHADSAITISRHAVLFRLCDVANTIAHNTSWRRVLQYNTR